jgi:hypothetical protein
VTYVLAPVLLAVLVRLVVAFVAARRHRLELERAAAEVLDERRRRWRSRFDRRARFTSRAS